MDEKEKNLIEPSADELLDSFENKRRDCKSDN